jgi:pimeloyl-ACP methyl ester carboxylesterase
VKSIYLILIVAVILVGALFIWTQLEARAFERRFPPIGLIANIDGRDIHYLDVPGSEDAGQVPVLFVHGASGNLRDQFVAYRDKMGGERRMVFIDRPGHGYSQRGGEDKNSPSGQAEVYKMLMDELGIDQAVLACHSLGCASGAAFAVHYPERVKGLVFVAPATHPWSTGVHWYYDLASLPVLGHLFTETLALPAGKFRLPAGVNSVFTPNAVPEDYLDQAAPHLVLRPKVFRNNARDVASLNRHVTELAPRYGEIKKPTVIITGTEDNIVSPQIHSNGLHEDIEGAELIKRDDVGHKPDYVLTDLVIEAINKVGR